MRSGLRMIGILAALGAATLQLSGCANDWRYKLGPEWVQSAEAERQRLDRAGFTQYSGPR